MAHTVNTKKCANPACSCIPADGSKYCGAHCESMDGKTEVTCACGHPSCRGDATQV